MLLRLAPWWRGPVLLLRRPGVALALAAAGFVAALPAAAAPLFLSSAQDATLHHQLARSCSWDNGLAVRSGLIYGGDVVGQSAGLASDLVASRQAEAAAATAGVTHLSPPVTTLLNNALNVGVGTAKGPTRSNLVSRSGFRDHLHGADGSSGPGLWLPDGLAATYGLHPGDRVTVGGAPQSGRPAGHPVTIPVAGVYTDLRGAPEDPYWCSLKPLWRGQPGYEDAVQPTVLADPEVFTQLGDAFTGIAAEQWIEYELSAPRQLTVGRAETLVTELDRARDRLTRSGAFAESTQFQSRLPNFVRRAHLVRSGLLPPVVPITTTGTLVGLLVVAAAAVFWVQRRGRELRVLAAHGVSAGGLGLKAVTEASAALVAGTAAGALCAWLLVGAVGPDARLAAEAVPGAVAAAGAALVAAVIAVGVVAALRCRALTDQRRPARRLRARHVPWELSLVAAAGAAWARLSGDTQLLDTATAGVGTVAHVPARLLVVPILLLVGVTVVAARLALGALRRQALRRTPRRPGALLAWRRLGREAVAAAVLAGAVGLPMALATYGVTVIGAVEDTTIAQARMVTGTDMVATLARPAPVPVALAGRATPVVRLDQVLAGGVLCDVLAVDPRTFGDGVAWDGRTDSPDPGRLARQLDGGRTGFGTGAAPTGPVQLSQGNRQLGRVTLRHTGLLPGAQAYPVLLVDRAAVDQAVLARGKQQLWIRGDTASAQRALAAARVPVGGYWLADELYAGTVYEAVTYTFTYLIALSVLTGAVTFVGLLLYLESRIAGHRRAYILLRRMGLSPGSHRWALLAELAAPLAAGLAAGVAAAYPVIRLLGPGFDVNPVAPPDALVSLPAATLGWIVAAAAAVAALAGLLAHHRISRANPAEVLRDTI
ncbi:FtsX-like permease family protein [Planosporangium sp. 12N6]|uniref:FtsX-like permease family protein n=1 Tax=Planosporangium spinosum TaxID=3402278 RepID=UPI003CF6FC3D